MGQLIGPLVELPVTQFLTHVPHSDRVWRPFDLLFKQLMDSQSVRVRNRRVIEVLQNMVALRFTQQRQTSQLPALIGNHRSEKDLKVSDPAFNGLAIKQITAVLDIPNE